MAGVLVWFSSRGMVEVRIMSPQPGKIGLTAFVEFFSPSAALAALEVRACSASVDHVDVDAG
eukprot:1568818-Rhodomonas_salina.1